MSGSSRPSNIFEVEAIPNLFFACNEEIDEGSLITANPMCDHDDGDDQGSVCCDVVLSHDTCGTCTAEGGMQRSAERHRKSEPEA
jgi:hypothetical protein